MFFIKKLSIFDKIITVIIFPNGGAYYVKRPYGGVLYGFITRN